MLGCTTPCRSILVTSWSIVSFKVTGVLQSDSDRGSHGFNGMLHSYGLGWGCPQGSKISEYSLSKSDDLKAIILKSPSWNPEHRDYYCVPSHHLDWLLKYSPLEWSFPASYQRLTFIAYTMTLSSGVMVARHRATHRCLGRFPITSDGSTKLSPEYVISQ